MALGVGELITEALDYDQGRQVTVYVPADAAEAVVDAADGAWHITRLSEALEHASIRSTMIVGVHGLQDDDGRLHEYVPGFSADRFPAHQRFFVGEVRHGDAFWAEEFPLMVAWAFGHSPLRRPV